MSEALNLALMALEKVVVGWTEAFAEYKYDSDIPSENQFRDEVFAAIAAIKEALAQPEQEPVAWIDLEKLAVGGMAYATSWKTTGKQNPLYTTPPQRKPQFKEFIKWAGAQGYDCAQTCNSGTGEWIVLNPMTADLWKAWQAAHGIKE